MQVIQTITGLFEDPEEVVTIVAEDSKAEVSLSAGLLNRLLYMTSRITANGHLKMTVNEHDFQGIKKHFGV